MLTDTHLHIADAHFDADRQAAIQRARDVGVTTLIEIAESPTMWDAAVALANEYPFVYASLGVHPHHAHLYGPGEWPGLSERLLEHLKNPKVVAIGEFGLDYFRMQNTKAQQDFLFRAQMDVAQKTRKPIVIHCREAEAPKLDAPENRVPGQSAHADIQLVLKEYYPGTSMARDCPEPAGVIHCFSGTWADAQTYFSRGFMVGVDGPVTYPSAKLLQQNILRMPLERIVLETDSPYLPPQSHRGQRNEPAYLPAVAAEIGKIKRKTPDEIAAQTSRNARALFRLPS
jgi:TatD DNase family protein